MIAIGVCVLNLQLALPPVVSMIAIEIHVVDHPLVLPLAMGMMGAKICVIPFSLTLSLELDIVALIESLVWACVMTEPDLVVMALSKEEIGKFLRM